MTNDLASQRRFDQIAEKLLAASRADDTFVSFSDEQSATLRFANNQVVQNVSIRRPSVSVRVAFGQRVGSAATNQLNGASLIVTLRRAEELAALAPEDPEFMPALPKQGYDAFHRYVKATANARPIHIAKRTAPVIDLCEQHAMQGAGILTNSSRATGVAAASGLHAYDQSTSATFSLTATADDSTGWTMNKHRDLNRLGIKDRTRVAVDKAILSKKPREIEPGHYTVILEPSATAGVFGPVLWSLGAKSYHKGTSALAGKLGTAVVDTRINLRSQPDHPDLLGAPFARDGMPHRRQTWIENGVLRQLQFDRFTAKEHGQEPTPWPSAPVLSYSGQTAASVDELVSQTERGVLITNFWYIRYVNPTDLTLTGMTRDGTFLVEDGKIVAGLRNFRFHDSPLRAFQQVDAATAPMESTTLERGKMLLPAVKLPDFNLSSVTKF